MAIYNKQKTSHLAFLFKELAKMPLNTNIKPMACAIVKGLGNIRNDNTIVQNLRTVAIIVATKIPLVLTNTK